jgi:T-complex protein 1 subunit eta
MLQPSILLLREGTDTTQGKSQIISNINACQSVVEIIKTTLGPRGMDKLIRDEKGVTISNDGATIIKLLDIVHPAAKTLVDIAVAQDNEVGDGTTSVVLLAGELLRHSKEFIDEGMAPQIVIKGYREALRIALAKVNDIAITISDKTDDEKRDILKKCAATSLNSKLLSNYKEFFSEMVVQAVERLDKDLLDRDLIGVKLVTGGSITDSFLVDGVAFKKTFSYAGFEQAPKQFKNPKICLLNVELEKKAEKENAEIRIDNPEIYQSLIDAEWDIIYAKLKNIVDAGANIVLSRLPIGDLAQQYFSDRGIFSAGRVPQEDLNRLVKSTGAAIQTTTNGIAPEVFGTCGEFEEIQIGAERYNIFKDCPSSKTATMVIRGGAEQFIAEAERSLNDAIMIVRRAVKANKIVAGAGSTEMEISKYLLHHARSISGKQQLVVNAFAKALEVIPRTIADNAGLDAIAVLNKLRQKHAHDGRWYGVDVNSQNGLLDAYESFIWEPLIIKVNALVSATEAACLVLSIDETVRNPQSEETQRLKKTAGAMPQRGRPMMAPTKLK